MAKSVTIAKGFIISLLAVISLSSFASGMSALMNGFDMDYFTFTAHDVFIKVHHFSACLAILLYADYDHNVTRLIGVQEAASLLCRVQFKILWIYLRTIAALSRPVATRFRHLAAMTCLDSDAKKMRYDSLSTSGTQTIGFLRP